MGIPVVESDVSYLKMVDITKSNFELKYDDIAKAIEKSAFIGMLELIKDHMFEYLGETAGEGDRTLQKYGIAHTQIGQSAEYGMCTPEIFWCKTCCTPVFLGVATNMGVALCGPIENSS